MTPKRLGRRSYLKLSAALVPTGVLVGHVAGGGDEGADGSDDEEDDKEKKTGTEDAKAKLAEKDLEGKRLEVGDGVVIEVLEHVTDEEVTKLQLQVSNETGCELEASWTAKGPIDDGSVTVPEGASHTFWIAVDEESGTVTLRADGETIVSLDVGSILG